MTPGMRQENARKEDASSRKFLTEILSIQKTERYRDFCQTAFPIQYSRSILNFSFFFFPILTRLVTSIV